METPWIVALVVAAVLVLAALVAFALVRRRDLRRQEAAGLRSRAAAHAPRLQETEREARLREAEAERLRLEAERAEQRAAEARGAVAHEEARVEDTVREADRLDPGVDHRSDDYRPQPPTQRGPAGGAPGGDPTVSPSSAAHDPRHR
ncbi:hypothetical protein [Nocardioides perillae]|uniref:Uncharacterized protein n=1 Tax=Nocardioides perillae TaxID=1119534 RepID=A0A7Y9RV32_9ACTN|nr:hypothetical protein [Nocardioides perillae]NYG54485.1 hypothetical protein [Nocardioides perillae]